MDTLLQIGILCLIASLFAALLKKTNPDMALLLILAVCVAALAALCRAAVDIADRGAALLSGLGLDDSVFLPMLKTLAIAIVSKLGGELCRDAGQNAAASLVETAGAFGAVLCAMPLLVSVWDVLRDLL